MDRWGEQRKSNKSGQPGPSGVPCACPIDKFQIIETCQAGLVLIVTRIPRAAVTKFRVYVCMYVCVTTPPKPLNQFA